ncbi:MAG: helix-turn-helix transcriptional regulator [Methylovulum sp.]|nr:helix-turn-helix transcriptional regulator [Methylovulum sp.]
MDEQNKKALLIKFGNGLRNLRSDTGLSQEELAERADIDRSYLGGIERGEHNLALINIIKIANALGVYPHQLLEIFAEPQDER